MLRPLRPCKEQGCSKLVKRGYCESHSKKHHINPGHHNSIEAKRDYDSMRKTSRQRGYDSKWDKFRRYYLRKNPICSHCHIAPAIIPHHKIPLPAGAKYDEENLAPVCIKCHNKTHHSNKL